MIRIGVAMMVVGLILAVEHGNEVENPTTGHRTVLGVHGGHP
jgi:hypothetical protein